MQQDGVDSIVKADLALKLVLVHLLLTKATSGPVFSALEVEAALGRVGLFAAAPSHGVTSVTGGERVGDGLDNQASVNLQPLLQDLLCGLHSWVT